MLSVMPNMASTNQEFSVVISGVKLINKIPCRDAIPATLTEREIHVITGIMNRSTDCESEHSHTLWYGMGISIISIMWNDTADNEKWHQHYLLSIPAGSTRNSASRRKRALLEPVEKHLLQSRHRPTYYLSYFTLLRTVWNALRREKWRPWANEIATTTMITRLYSSKQTAMWIRV